MAAEHAKPGDIWMDPCRGGGALYNLFPVDDDSKIWCEIDEGINFMEDDRGYNVAVVNPPFSIYTPFLERIVDDAPTVIVLLFGCMNVSSKRMKILKEADYCLVSEHHTYWNVVFGSMTVLQCWVMDAEVESAKLTMDTTMHKSKVGGNTFEKALEEQSTQAAEESRDGFEMEDAQVCVPIL